MRVGIIGFGFVGQAMASVICDKVHLSILDPKHSTQSFQTFIETQPKIIFICVPTPTVNGACNDSMVIEYVKRLKTFDGIVVVKSTVPPATVEKISEINPKIVIWPELLREKHANEDMANPTLTIIGASFGIEFAHLENFITSFTNIRVNNGIRHVTPIEASIFKYAVNSFLATKVLFMHQMYQWIDTRGETSSWPIISELLASEGRIGATHLTVPGDHGLGFAGTCFPKDTEALLEQVGKDKTTFPILESIIGQNKELRSS